MMSRFIADQERMAHQAQDEAAIAIMIGLVSESERRLSQRHQHGMG